MLLILVGTAGASTLASAKPPKAASTCRHDIACAATVKELLGPCGSENAGGAPAEADCECAEEPAGDSWEFGTGALSMLCSMVSVRSDDISVLFRIVFSSCEIFPVPGVCIYLGLRESLKQILAIRFFALGHAYVCSVR